MRICDIDLIKNPEILFDTEIVLYGAGYWGKKVSTLLKMTGIDIACFCDKKAEDEFAFGKMISIDELKAMTRLRNIIIIITTDLYVDEIIKDLESKEIVDADIYTLFGLWCCIELNINSEYFTPEFCTHIRQMIDIRRWARCYELYNHVVLPIKVNIQNFGNPGVMIFQPGKVGSSTIKRSLEIYNIPNVHLHNFQLDSGINEEDRERVLPGFNDAKKAIQEIPGKIQIITLVREPVSREIAVYMHGLGDGRNRSENFREDIILSVTEYMERVTNTLGGGGVCLVS